MITLMTPLTINQPDDQLPLSTLNRRTLLQESGNSLLLSLRRVSFRRIGHHSIASVLLPGRCPEMMKMAKKRLTDRTLKALKPTGKRYDVMDADVPGFGVRLTERGQRTFILVARYPGSPNPTRRAIGEYPAVSLEKLVRRHGAT